MLVVLKCVYLMVKWSVCLCEEWIVVVAGWYLIGCEVQVLQLSELSELEGHIAS